MPKESTTADNNFKGDGETRVISDGQNNNNGLTGRKIHQNIHMIFEELRLRKDKRHLLCWAGQLFSEPRHIASRPNALPESTCRFDRFWYA